MEDTKVAPKTDGALYTKLSDKIAILLMKQYKHELGNSNLYRSMANFCNDKQYKGFEKYFEKQSDEEVDHSKVFGEYLINKKVSLGAPVIESFEITYSCLMDLFIASLKREKLTTDMIKQIAKDALSEGDYQTYELALIMLKEQVLEEAQFIDLIDECTLACKSGGGEYLMDVQYNK